MKKITLLVLFGLLTLGVNAQCDPCVATTFNFDTDGNQEAWDYTPSGGNVIAVSGGLLVYSLDGTLVTPNIRHANFKSSVHQYFHIVLKNESNANEIRFNYKDPADATKTKFVNVAITTGDTGYKTYTIFAGTDALTWKSDDISANLRFDNAPARTATISGKITIDKIVVDNNATLGLENFENLNFSFYPNPTKDVLRMHAGESIDSVQVYDLLGANVVSKKYDKQSNVALDMSSLTTGMYVLKVQIAGKLGTFKIMKE
jgi:hypothetical protein